MFFWRVVCVYVYLSTMKHLQVLVGEKGKMSGWDSEGKREGGAWEVKGKREEWKAMRWKEMWMYTEKEREMD